MDLKELLGEELYNQVIQKVGDNKIDIVSNGNWIPKDKFNITNEQLKTANSTIESLKKSNVDNEELQRAANEYKQKYEDSQAEMVRRDKEYTLKGKLKDLGITDVDYLIYKHGGVDKFNFDKEGKLIGLEDTINPYKESIPHIFKQEEQKQPQFSGVNPVESAANKTKVDTSKMSYTELCKYIEENPNAQI